MTKGRPDKTPWLPSRRFFFSAGFVSSLLLLCSCLAMRPAKSLAIPPMEPAERHIEGVPFFPAEGMRCGPAALASVISYYGLDADPEEIGSSVLEPENAGAYHQNIYLYGVKRGMNAQMYSGGIRDLKRMVAMDRPVIILLDLSLIGEPYGHYVVVVGYDEGHIYVHDSIYENRKLSRRFVYVTWKKVDFMTVLILPPDAPLPPTTDELLDDALAAEAAGDWPEAERLYRRALERGDVRVGAIIGVGNARLHLGDSQSAIAWYKLALRHDPDRGDARINMAAACLQLDKTRKACNLVREVLREPSSPYRAYALDTLGDIHRAEDRIQQALDAYNQALENPPANDPAFESNVKNKIKNLKNIP